MMRFWMSKQLSGSGNPKSIKTKYFQGVLLFQYRQTQLHIVPDINGIDIQSYLTDRQARVRIGALTVEDLLQGVEAVYGAWLLTPETERQGLNITLFMTMLSHHLSTTQAEFT